MPKKKTVFVFTGLPGSGKDSCLGYLQTKYQAAIFSFTTMLKDVLDRFYLEYNRDNLIKLSENIRQTFGEDTLAKTMAQDTAKAQANLIAIGNARRLADIKYLSTQSGFVLIEVAANIKLRYERVNKRTEKTNDSQQTFDQFVADHQRNTELSILELTKQASERIDNNGSLENLRQQLDTLVKKYAN